MAQMLPPVCPEGVSSSGERFIFGELSQAPDDWRCLHSLELSRHVSKVCGEIDFVVMVPGEGVFCLEVKSGGISRLGGTWLCEDRHGNVHTNHEGPFKQSKTAMYSLRDFVEKRFDPEDRLRNVLYGWGVVLPDVEFSESGTDMESWRVYDIRSRESSITEYITQLSEGSHSILKQFRRYDEKESRPTRTDIERLAQFLRGDFELHVKRGLYAQELREEIIRLTNEQTEHLENLRYNPRCLFTGAAGTGKTVLAVEFAKREALKGKRVLFLCYNKLLAQRLKAELSEFRSKVTVETFHHYIDQLVSESSFKESFIEENSRVDDDTRFRELFPIFALDAIAEGNQKPFDVLVLDECQDLLIPEYLDVFGALVSGGLEKGQWAFFGDTCFQNIFNRTVTPEQMIEALGKRSPGFPRYWLSKNCRNTRNIGNDTYKIVGLHEPPYRPSAVTGSPVVYLYYHEPSEQTAMIQRLVRELKGEGIERNDITVLSPRRLGKCSFSDQFPDIDIKFCDMTNGMTCRDHENGVNFCTIQGFKGLENSVIIVTDIPDLDKDQFKSLIYVAMSRAHIRLFMLLPKSLKKKVQRILK